MARATCPACDEDIRISDHARVGQTFDCYQCAERLIVMQLNPVVLEWSEDTALEDGRVEHRKVGSKVKNKRSPGSENVLTFDAVDWWITDDDDRERRDRRSRKKKSRGKRDFRRRRTDLDSPYDDF